METELVLVFELKLEEIVCEVVSGMSTSTEPSSTSEILFSHIQE
jgi:hypothetical protein